MTPGMWATHRATAKGVRGRAVGQSAPRAPEPRDTETSLFSYLWHLPGPSSRLDISRGRADSYLQASRHDRRQGSRWQKRATAGSPLTSAAASPRESGSPARTCPPGMRSPSSTTCTRRPCASPTPCSAGQEFSRERSGNTSTSRILLPCAPSPTRTRSGRSPARPQTPGRGPPPRSSPSAWASASVRRCSTRPSSASTRVAGPRCSSARGGEALRRPHASYVVELGLVPLSADQAHALGLLVDTVAYRLARTRFDDAGDPLETSDLILPVDRWLVRVGSARRPGPSAGSGPRGRNE